MNKNLKWDSHKGHLELLKEFYYFNKYLITEQLKDALLDAIDCMEYTMTEEGEKYKEEGKKYHMLKDDGTRNLTDEETDIYNSRLETEAKTIDEISLL